MLPTEIEAIRKATQEVEDKLFKPKEEPKPGEPPKEEPPKEPPKEEPPKVEPPKEEPPKEEPPKEPPKPEDFEHKFKVLKGKYDKEIPRVSQEAREAKDRAIELEAENARLRTEITGLKSVPKPVETPKPEVKSITLEDLEKEPDVSYIKEQFPDVWKAMKRIAQRTIEVTPSVDSNLKGKVEKIESDLGSISKAVGELSLKDFHKYLDGNIEGWRTINIDPAFREWLGKTDPYSGKPKMELIQDGINHLDGERVARFFIDFAKENIVPPKEVVNVEEPIKKETPKEPVKPGQSDIAPSRGITPPPPKREDISKDIITTEHITDFYEKIRRGQFIGREAERDAEEKRIEKAVVEGRVK